MKQRYSEFEQEVRKGLAKSILGNDWDGLVKRNGEEATVKACLGGLDAIVTTKRARQLRKRAKWRKRFNRIKRICQRSAAEA